MALFAELSGRFPWDAKSRAFPLRQLIEQYSIDFSVSDAVCFLVISLCWFLRIFGWFDVRVFIQFVGILRGNPFSGGGRCTRQADGNLAESPATKVVWLSGYLNMIFGRRSVMRRKPAARFPDNSFNFREAKDASS